MFKKIFLGVLSTVMIAGAFSGCGEKEVKLNSKTADSLAIQNFTPPQDGEDIVVLTIKDYGEVKIKLFEDISPKGSQNFIGLAKKGYYDGLIFHRVIKNFMIQGGDPLGNGTGGESLWGGKFDGGAPKGLYHFAGAVAYANSGSTATDGSQFYIVTGEKQTDDSLKQIENYYGKTFTDEVKEKYKEIGGTPHLDGDYTVFGQVIDGLDIVYKISETQIDSSDKPVTAVTIEKAEVVPYDGSEIHWTVDQ